MRKLHINSQVWTYKIGKKYVIVKGPKNERLVALHHEILNLSNEELLDICKSVFWCGVCQEKYAFCDDHVQERERIYLTPGKIKTYIENNRIRLLPSLNK